MTIEISRKPGGRPPKREQGESLAALTRRYRHAKARKAELEADRLEGALVDRRLSGRVLFDLAREIRDAWTNWPERESAIIADKLGITDTMLVFRVLEAAVRAELQRQVDHDAPRLRDRYLSKTAPAERPAALDRAHKAEPT
jgi:hypothetical protein